MKVVSKFFCLTVKINMFCSSLYKIFHVGMKFYNYFSDFQFMGVVVKKIGLVDFLDWSPILLKI